jgi:hypothetical protein
MPTLESLDQDDLDQRPSALRRFATRAGWFAGLLLLVIVVTRTVSGSEVGAGLLAPTAPPAAEIVNMPGRRTANGDATSARGLSFDTLIGRSRRVRARLVSQEDVDAYPALLQRFGEDVRRPGIRTVEGAPNGDFAFITLTPWRAKLGSSLNGYRLGLWPAERRAMPSNYDNPVGFIEVVRENEMTWLSTHFRLRDFVTHDQQNVWPKYVVLREELLDKLELVLETLEAQGVPTQRAVVLSGFRSPQYNERGWGEGMAYASRHQYGDAADIIIDANGDGRMDDLNGDGTVDFQDTGVINSAVERVEQRFPDLIGGLGLYHAMGPRGPFAHIDVRGTRARWSNSGKSKRGATTRWDYETPTAPKTGRCLAEGAMAVLCAGVK